METATVGTELIPRTSIELMEAALEYLNSIREIIIKTQPEYEEAASVCKQIKGHINTLEKNRKELVEPYNKKVKAINDKYKEVTTKLQNGDGHIRQAMSAYYQEQERKRQEEQRKLQAEADEKRRKAEEAARKEAEKVEQYRQEGREEMAQKAEARMETAVEVATTTVAPEVEQKKVSGISYRTEYECHVKDHKAAVLFCIDSPNFVGTVLIDIKAIERAAKAFKGKLSIPGIEIIEKKIPIVRS
jgi:DNA repair exonuclease SbcCD ATPase subunit